MIGIPTYNHQLNTETAESLLRLERLPKTFE